MLQLEGAVTIGGNDYSDEITSVIIRRRRASVTDPATYGNARETQAAGALQEEIQLNFLNHKAATKVWAELWDAIDTPTAELAFTVLLAEGAKAADNPSFEGTMIVMGVEVGGQVMQHNQQSWTFPITSAGITRDTTP
jgi:hypothetical protein